MIGALVSVLLSVAGAVEAPSHGFVLGNVSADFGGEWKCRNENVEVFCTPGAETPASEMIVVVAHARHKDETLEAFQKHLKEPRNFTGADGKKFVSEVKTVRKVKIDGRNWIDGLQYQSELPGYYTRYFATVTGTLKSGQSIVVTYTFKKDRLEAYGAKAPALTGAIKIDDTK